MTKQFRNFESAREFVRSLKLKSKKEWLEYRKSGNKPDNIPSFPWDTYKNKGWKSVGDFLGTMTVSTNEKIFLSFKESREFVRSLKLKSKKEWLEYRNSGNKPDNIPSNPERTYKKEWKGTSDFLGNGYVKNYNIKYRPFKDAREFVRKLKISGQPQWQREYCKSGNKPNDIPATPQKVYKKDWKGWGDWTGTGNMYNTEWRDFEKAREFVRSLGLKGQKEWGEYCKSGNKPDDIPANPYGVYKK
jgi:hypothetical protein